MNIDAFANWLTSHLMEGPEVVMTEHGPMNITKARILADEGELTLVPLKTGITGMREIRFNTLLYDILTERGFKLDLSTGQYHNETTLRDSAGSGEQRQAG